MSRTTQTHGKSITGAVLSALAALALAAGLLAGTGCTPQASDDGSQTPATSSSSDASPQSDEATPSQDEQAALSIEVSVDSSAADGSASFTGTVELPAGSSAYDALLATGLDVQASESQYGMYIESVAGLENGAFGEMSGWVYEVNGEAAMVAADAYELADGDSVAWTFSTGA